MNRLVQQPKLVTFTLLFYQELESEIRQWLNNSDSAPMETTWSPAGTTNVSGGKGRSNWKTRKLGKPEKVGTIPNKTVLPVQYEFAPPTDSNHSGLQTNSTIGDSSQQITTQITSQAIVPPSVTTELQASSTHSPLTEIQSPSQDLISPIDANRSSQIVEIPQNTYQGYPSNVDQLETALDVSETTNPKQNESLILPPVLREESHYPPAFEGSKRLNSEPTVEIDELVPVVSTKLETLNENAQNVSSSVNRENENKFAENATLSSSACARLTGLSRFNFVWHLLYFTVFTLPGFSH
ncbi:unnamed protein product [Protopolystoma xenopodis]|uniref:Uncharacterized protein n=1 Tax=Protopolystoma xenopodis TaxID=117903 RepID=A0A3S5BEJ0_9PLAT|nr:unnamed protein product [Protopolystoma xenopodis]